MEKRKYYYLKAININFKITTGFFLIDMGLVGLFFLFCFLMDFLNPYYTDFTASIFMFIVFIFLVVFNIVCVSCEIKGECKSLIEKRKIYFIHSIIKLIPSVILFLYSTLLFISSYEDDSIFWFIFFILHLLNFILSVISFVLCLLCKKKDIIEIERNLQCPK